MRQLIFDYRYSLCPGLARIMKIIQFFISARKMQGWVVTSIINLCLWYNRYLAAIPFFTMVALLAYFRFGKPGSAIKRD